MTNSFEIAMEHLNSVISSYTAEIEHFDDKIIEEGKFLNSLIKERDEIIRKQTELMEAICVLEDADE
ncbi:MAG: hypothetical protein PVI43_01230 [Candidatus Bathyarchaeota archaeon]|jgi:hypothetical protein